MVPVEVCKERLILNKEKCKVPNAVLTKPECRKVLHAVCKTGASVQVWKKFLAPSLVVNYVYVYTEVFHVLYSQPIISACEVETVSPKFN